MVYLSFWRGLFSRFFLHLELHFLHNRFCFAIIESDYSCRHILVTNKRAQYSWENEKKCFECLLPGREIHQSPNIFFKYQSMIFRDWYSHFDLNQQNIIFFMLGTKHLPDNYDTLDFEHVIPSGFCHDCFLVFTTKHNTKDAFFGHLVWQIFYILIFICLVAVGTQKTFFHFLKSIVPIFFLSKSIKFCLPW